MLDCPVTKCDKLKKTERGTFEWSCGDITLVSWNDNKVVVSNHLSSEPASNCKRYSHIQKQKMDVLQPNVIRNIAAIWAEWINLMCF